MATNGVGLETLRSLVRGILNERDEVYAPDLAKELIATYGGADWWTSLKDDVFERAIYGKDAHLSYGWYGMDWG